MHAKEVTTSIHATTQMTRREAVARTLAALALLGGATLACAGCANSKNSKRDRNQTIDDVLSAEKPGW
ncbi:MAG: hypothetical protein Q4G03_02470 [Planctomycetia bacterium]|nr:hypothetical protein [Planctomycetia bacterium]